MNFTEMLKPIKCSCGQTHSCDIKHVIVEENGIRSASECEKPPRSNKERLKNLFNIWD